MPEDKKVLRVGELNASELNKIKTEVALAHQGKLLKTDEYAEVNRKKK